MGRITFPAEGCDCKTLPSKHRLGKVKDGWQDSIKNEAFLKWRKTAKSPQSGKKWPAQLPWSHKKMLGLEDCLGNAEVKWWDTYFIPCNVLDVSYQHSLSEDIQICLFQDFSLSLRCFLLYLRIYILAWGIWLVNRRQNLDVPLEYHAWVREANFTSIYINGPQNWYGTGYKSNLCSSSCASAQQ